MSEARLLSPEALDVIRAAYEQRFSLSPAGYGPLLGHIDAMTAGEAKLRALHHEDGGCCAHCIQPWPDDYQTWGAAKWPCQTMRILDGI